MFHCSVIKVLCCCRFSTAHIGYHTVLSLSRTFFFFFEISFSREEVFSCSNCCILPQSSASCQQLFLFFLTGLLPRRQCLSILPSCFAFVNGLFHIFSFFLPEGFSSFSAALSSSIPPCMAAIRCQISSGAQSHHFMWKGIIFLP